jgi:hypothetical protein
MPRRLPHSLFVVSKKLSVESEMGAAPLNWLYHASQAYPEYPVDGIAVVRQ